MPPKKRKEYTTEDLMRLNATVSEIPRTVIGELDKHDVETSLGWVPYKRNPNEFYGISDGYDDTAREQFDYILKEVFHLDIEADPADALSRIVMAGNVGDKWSSIYSNKLKEIKAMPESKDKYALREKEAKEFIKGLFYEMAKGGLAIIKDDETEPRQVRYDSYKGHFIITEPFSKCDQITKELNDRINEIERPVFQGGPSTPYKPTFDRKKPVEVEDPGEFNRKIPTEPVYEEYVETDLRPEPVKDMLEGTTADKLFGERFEAEKIKRGIVKPVKPVEPEHADVIFLDKKGVEVWLDSSRYPKIPIAPAQFNEVDPRTAERQPVRQEPARPRFYFLKSLVAWMGGPVGREMKAYHDDHNAWEQEVRAERDAYNSACSLYDQKLSDYEYKMHQYQEEYKSLRLELSRNYARVHGREPDYEQRLKDGLVMQEVNRIVDETIEAHKKAVEFDAAKREYDRKADKLYDEMRPKFNIELEKNQDLLKNYNQRFIEWLNRSDQREARKNRVEKDNGLKEGLYNREVFYYEEAKKEHARKKQAYNNYVEEKKEYDEAKLAYEQKLKKYEEELARYEAEDKAYKEKVSQKQDEYDEKINALIDTPLKREYRANLGNNKYFGGFSYWRDTVTNNPDVIKRQNADLDELKKKSNKRREGYNYKKRTAPKVAGKVYTKDVIVDSVYGKYPREAREYLTRIDNYETEEVGKLINADSIGEIEYKGYAVMQDFYRDARKEIMDACKGKGPNDKVFIGVSLSSGAKEDYTNKKLKDKVYIKSIENEAKIKNGNAKEKSEARRLKLLNRSGNELAKQYLKMKGPEMQKNSGGLVK